MDKKLVLDRRTGPGPEVLRRLPHSQLTQHGPDAVIDQLHAWCFALAGVLNEPSGISVPGSRALVLSADVQGNQNAFMIGREFAHIHPKPDNGSLHLMLPPVDVRVVKEMGWGEDHYLVTQGQWPTGLMMVYSSRNDAELSIVKQIVKCSHAFAIGHRS